MATCVYGLKVLFYVASHHKSLLLLPAGEVVSLEEAQERAQVYEAQGLQHTYVMDYTCVLFPWSLNALVSHQ